MARRRNTLDREGASALQSSALDLLPVETASLAVVADRGRGLESGPSLIAGLLGALDDEVVRKGVLTDVLDGQTVVELGHEPVEVNT